MPTKKVDSGWQQWALGIAGTLLMLLLTTLVGLVRGQAAGLETRTGKLEERQQQVEIREAEARAEQKEIKTKVEETRDDVKQIIGILQQRTGTHR